MRYFTKIVILAFCHLFLVGIFIKNHLADLNPDGISYIEIAELYQSLKISNAINAYWSPIYSIFIAIFDLAVPYLFSAKILTLLLSFGWFMVSFFFSRNLLKNNLKAFFVSVLVIIFPGTTEMLILLTPDLMLSMYVVLFLWIFLKLLTRNGIRVWFLFGLISGIGYLIKSIFLPFSSMFVPLVLFISYKRSGIKKILIFYCGLYLIASLWALVLYTKYHQFTFGTAFRTTYNNAISRKEFIFLKEPKMYYSYGTSFWIDPSEFGSINFDLKRQFSLSYENFKSVIRVMSVNLNLGLILFFIGIHKAFNNRYSLILILFSTVWILLHLTVLVEARYLWPIMTPLFIVIMDGITIKNRLVYFSFLILTIIIYIRTYTMHLAPDENSIFHEKISQSLEPNCVLLSDQWHRGLYISFLSKCKYYGVTRFGQNENFNENEFTNEIKAGKVSHFLTFDGEKYLNKSLLTTKKSWKFNDNKVVLSSVKYEE